MNVSFRAPILRSLRWPAEHTVLILRLAGSQHGRAQGTVALGILIVLMTSALVVAIWSVAKGKLVGIVETALDTVCGDMGC